MIPFLSALILGTLLLLPLLVPQLNGCPLLDHNDQAAILGMVCFYLLNQAHLQGRRAPVSTKEDATKKLQEKNSELAERVRVLDAELGTLSTELRQEREQAENLSRALTEAQSRLAAAAIRPTAQASSQSIAEALQLLSLLQQRGRLIDFVMQDITAFPNEQVGSVARFVHQGCQSVFKECFDIAAVREEPEGSAIEIQQQPNPEQIRLQGRTPQYPTRAKIIHRGWQTRKAALPMITGERQPPYILAPADVEIV